MGLEIFYFQKCSQRLLYLIMDILLSVRTPATRWMATGGNFGMQFDPSAEGHQEQLYFPCTFVTSTSSAQFLSPSKHWD